MSQKIVASASENARVLLPPNASGQPKHRLALYIAWLDDSDLHWLEPDLAAYRDYLLSDERLVQRGSKLVASPLQPASAQTHLSTIRGRYRKLLDDNRVRDLIYKQVPADMGPADRKAYVDELLLRLENAIKPGSAPVKVVTKQDRVDSEHTRLTRAQAGALMAAPKSRRDNTALQTLRDTAMIALMLCTGIREMELCALDLDDLRQYVNSELVLRVRQGKGVKQRVVPYGSLDWSLSILDTWLLAAGIPDCPVLEPKPGLKRPDKKNPGQWLKVYPVFRGFYRGGTSVRPSRLTVRAVNQTLDRYPISVNGRLQGLKPHDLRRTYARRLYEEGIPPVVIQQNLGHSDLKTTLGYIGDLEIEQRRPPAIYDQPDLRALAALA